MSKLELFALIIAILGFVYEFILLDQNKPID